MDAQTLKLLQQAVREGVASATWLMVVVALLAAGVGAFFGAYLKRKGEDLALGENFNESLKRLEAQTKATSEIQQTYAVQLKKMESLEAQSAFIRELFSSGLREYSTSQAHGLRQAYLLLFEPISSTPASQEIPLKTRLEMAVQAVMQPLRNSIGLLDEATIACIQEVQNELLELHGKLPEEALQKKKSTIFGATERARQFVKADEIAYRLGLIDGKLKERRKNTMMVKVRKLQPGEMAIPLGRRTFCKIGEEVRLQDDEIEDAKQAIKDGYLEELPQSSS